MHCTTIHFTILPNTKLQCTSIEWTKEWHLIDGVSKEITVAWGSQEWPGMARNGQEWPGMARNGWHSCHLLSPVDTWQMGSAMKSLLLQVSTVQEWQLHLSFFYSMIGPPVCHLNVRFIYFNFYFNFFLQFIFIWFCTVHRCDFYSSIHIQDKSKRNFTFKMKCFLLLAGWTWLDWTGLDWKGLWELCLNSYFLK